MTAFKGNWARENARRAGGSYLNHGKPEPDLSRPRLIPPPNLIRRPMKNTMRPIKGR